MAKGDSLDKIRKEVANYLRNLIFYVLNLGLVKNDKSMIEFVHLSWKYVKI